MNFGPEQWTVTVGPVPIVTKHDDGHLTVNWNTRDGEPPRHPILVAPELLVQMIDQYNDNVRPA